MLNLFFVKWQLFPHIKIVSHKKNWNTMSFLGIILLPRLVCAITFIRTVMFIEFEGKVLPSCLFHPSRLLGTLEYIPHLKVLMCGINVSSAQWRGCIFRLCYTHLKLVLLLHNTVLINFPIGTTLDVILLFLLWKITRFILQ